MNLPTIGLGEISSALSHLHFAVRETLSPLWCDIEIRYTGHVGLLLEISSYGRNVQKIADRIRHGVLVGPYDYRFRSSVVPAFSAEHAWVTMQFYPDLQYDDALVKTRIPK